jgi:hypothetical protein
MEASRPAPGRPVHAARQHEGTSEPTGLVHSDGAAQTGAPKRDVALRDLAPRDVAPRDLAPHDAGDGEAVRATSFLQRAALRRRLRYLRRRQEPALRELGDLLLESHRRGEQRPATLGAKLAALEQMASESERLERALDERRELLVLREPGITVCASCATLHGSDDRFCPHCGTPTATG